MYIELADLGNLPDSAHVCGITLRVQGRTYGYFKRGYSLL